MAIDGYKFLVNSEQKSVGGWTKFFKVGALLGSEVSENLYPSIAEFLTPKLYFLTKIPPFFKLHMIRVQVLVGLCFLLVFGFQIFIKECSHGQQKCGFPSELVNVKSGSQKTK